MEQGLTRVQAAGIRAKEAGASLLFLQILTVIAVSITLLAFYGSGSFRHRGAAEDALERAYHHAVARDVTPKSFPSREEVLARLEAQSGLRVLTGAPAADYRALKRDGGGQGSVYVRSVSPAKLALVARVRHQAIEELDVSLPEPGVDSSRFRALYTGRLHWSLYWWFAAGEALLCSLLGIGLGLVDARPHVARRRLWHSVVNDSRLGPLLPEKGFKILVPTCADEGEQVHFGVNQLTWKEEGNAVSWKKESLPEWRYPDGLKPQALPRAQGVAVASGQWFDFCAQVAAGNAERWQATLAERQAKAEAERQSTLAEQRQAEQLAELEQAESEGRLAPVLAPAADLMRQALDAGPLD